MTRNIALPPISGMPNFIPLLLQPRWLHWMGVVGFVGYFLQASPLVRAQVVSDRTLLQPTRVTRQGNTIDITGGTSAGNNLFHSFEQFSIPEGNAAIFNNDATVENIFSRVTGRSLSQIDGELRTNGGANLFLLNPNGIVFGANAKLNIGGSFIGSTADRLQFADGFTYSAVNPQTTPVLTISTPIGLQFSGDRSGQIRVRGNGHNLFLNSPDDPSVNRNDRPVGIQVNLGQTLAFVGGDVTIQGGNLTAAAGRIDVGSVVAGSVALETIQPGWQLNYSAVPEFGDIRLSQAASLEASGDRGGNIQVQGRRVQITGASAILADTLGGGTGASLTLRATERLRLTGSIDSPTQPFVSRLSTDVGLNATGQGGVLSIIAPTFQISDGGQVSSGTFGVGRGGTIRIQTDTLQVQGGSLIGPSGIFVQTAATASGDGGRLMINTDRLQLADQAQIAASTFGEGNAGTLTVRANAVELREGSGIFSIVNPGGSGNGNTVNLTADRLRLTEGSQIAASTAGAGSAGNIIVRARDIELSGNAGRFASGLFAIVEAEGKGGNITVTSDRISIRDGGEISLSTFGSGRAGNLRVNAEDIEIDGGSARNPSALVAASESSGNSGRLTVNADRLRLTGGGQIAASTSGSGDAGDIEINAALLELVGGNERGRSGLFSSAIESTGAGGNVQVTADRVMIEDGATISVSNFPSNPNFQPGRGGVGNLTLNANQILLNNQSLMTADSAAGDRGNINLQSSNTVLLRGSTITTNARGSASGGNLNITSALLTATGNSDITANSVSNFGGQVTIDANAVLGTQIRSQLTDQSDITAFSELGTEFSGTVQLNAPFIDLSRGLVQLPELPIDASNQIAAACDAATEGNAFVITGRGGLPETPVQTLRGATFWEDLRTTDLESQEAIEEVQDTPPINTSMNRSNNYPVEAKGWRMNESGQVILIAQALNQPENTIDCAVAGDPK
jgi:filamentous hemagglutinin family protein